ncbi:RraA family protein [Prauserella endophytica]|uniref:Putative 4-hydroxy-4-methyl-2-oxoglutarate aldolase n=1 Tax=Prauserella endophytica TaxID=1592324 RepID=A0ABY2S6M3_9PSEU|nr:RraA family protein [Prauserella endophytica]TKG70949.1 RraA family protein [Prauserella endophytica]
MFISAATDNIRVAPTWKRPDPDLLTPFGAVSVANVGDVLQRMTVMDGGIRLLTGNDALVGHALTVDVRPGDNLAIHRALDEARPGDVLVVNGRGDSTRALIGDLIGEIMISTGVVGAVIDGAIRDVATLSRQGLPVYARAATPAGPFKTGPGAVGEPVAVGGVVVGPGDVVVGDADGVVVVPQGRLTEIGARLGAVADAEEGLRARILAARANASTGAGR